MALSVVTNSVTVGHAHRDRRRVLAEADYKKVFLSAARVLGTVLVDGFVTGTWKLNSKREELALEITPFVPFGAATRDAVRSEAEALLHFVNDDHAITRYVIED